MPENNTNPNPTNGAPGLDTPEKFPNLQAYLINLEQNIRNCCEAVDIDFDELTNDQDELTDLSLSGSTINRTAGWGC